MLGCSILYKMKKASIKDIAEYLKVSVSAVSLTLNNRGDEKRISKNTQKRIFEYAAKVNYQPNPFAKGLKKGSSDTIGLVVPNISDSFYARIARRIEKKAEEYGYNVVFCSTGESKEREKELIQSMLNRKVDGLIVATSQKNEESIKGLKKSGVPFVLIDRYYPGIETDFVICDNKSGTKHAVEYLIGLGVKRIGYVSIKTELEVMNDRFMGYKETLENNGLYFDPALVHELDHENYMHQMGEVFDSYQNMINPVEAILFSTHYLTTSGLREIQKRNLNIPNDYKIISYDEHVTFDVITPAITVITQPVTEMGDQSVKILLDKLRSKGKSIKKVVLDTGFIPRKSCGE